MSQQERDMYIEMICLMSNWSKQALQNKSDKELIELYDRYRNM